MEKSEKTSVIIDAVDAGRTDEVLELIQEYLEWMVTEHPHLEKVQKVVESQGVTTELTDLAGYYERLWLATIDGKAVGCSMFKRLNETTAEMKRVYVRPSGRGHGFGRRLVETTIDAARDAGYQYMYLDSDPEFATAIAMYERMGYEYIERYNHNPAEDAVFMRLAL